MYLYIYYFHILFHYGLSQDIEYCSLCVLYNKTLLFPQLLAFLTFNIR